MKTLQKNSVVIEKLHTINIATYKTYSGVYLTDTPLSYQLFGLALGKAPIVMVNHALTGNSNVSGENGWWKEIINDNKVIDTKKYTKLLILGELDLVNELENVRVQNIVPLNLRDVSTVEFLENLSDFDTDYQKQTKKQDHVLRYFGEIPSDLTKDNEANLEVKLKSILVNLPLEQLKKSDILRLMNIK